MKNNPPTANNTVPKLVLLLKFVDNIIPSAIIMIPRIINFLCFSILSSMIIPLNYSSSFSILLLPIIESKIQNPNINPIILTIIISLPNNCSHDKA